MRDATEFHPGLTGDRLRTLADVIVRIRREALLLHDPDAGERNLSLGMRTFERACEAFRRLAAEVDWLGIHEQNNAFVLLVDHVFPLKFHRADPDHPTPRTTLELGPEIAAKQRAFAFLEGMPTSFRPAAGAFDSLWRIYFVDDPETKEVFRVALAQVGEDGKTVQSWPIDLSETLPTLARVGEPLPEPTELDEPLVSPRAVEGAPSDETNEPARAEDERELKKRDAPEDADA